MYTDDSSIDVSSLVTACSSDSSIASVGLVDGKYVVSGNSPGTAIITTTYAGRTDTVSVTVSTEMLRVQSMDLITGLPADATFSGVEKTEIQLSAKITFEDGTIIPDITMRPELLDTLLLWSTSVPSAIEVTNTGQSILSDNHYESSPWALPCSALSTHPQFSRTQMHRKWFMPT